MNKRRVRKLNSTMSVKLPWQDSDITIEPINKKNILWALDQYGITLDKDRLSKCIDYLLSAKELNKEVNLVSRTNVGEVLVSSLYESFAPMGLSLWKKEDISLLDLGTGGGFPGIPLAIANPDIKVSLLDSRRAKTLALKKMLGELDLNEVEVIHNRAEILKNNDEYLFDFVTARYVGSLKEVMNWADGLLKNEGIFFTWKGPESHKEMKEIDLQKWKLVDQKQILPHRNILAFKKVK